MLFPSRFHYVKYDQNVFNCLDDLKGGDLPLNLKRSLERQIHLSIVMTQYHVVADKIINAEQQIMLMIIN